MNLTLSCSSEDTEFINLVQKEFSDKGTIKEFRVIVILATHDERLANKCNKVINLNKNREII